jgi:hypothetical protein
MRTDDLLTDSAFDDLVIAGVESIYKRGVLISHNTRMNLRLKIAEREIARLQALAEGSARPCPADAQEGHQKAPQTPPPTLTPTEVAEEVQRAREAIVAWIEKTNPGDTVRAAYARKVAAQLRAGEDLR